jgi:sterol O-acyltransferase
MGTRQRRTASEAGGVGAPATPEQPVVAGSPKYKPRDTPSEFKARLSTFDPSSKASPIESSSFHGFNNLIGFALTYFILETFARNWQQTGTILDFQLLASMFGEQDLAVAWAALFVYSFTAVLLEKVRLLGILPDLVLSILQHAGQTFLFTAVLAWLWVRHWPFVQTSFFVLYTCVVYMKMHSYTMVNRSLYKQRLFLAAITDTPSLLPVPVNVPSNAPDKPLPVNGQTDPGPAVPGSPRMGINPRHPVLIYPANVTFSNFFLFHCFPTLVYELNYPRTDSIRPMYVLEKLLSALGVLTGLYIVVTQFIQPVIPLIPKSSLAQAVRLLFLPFSACYLMVFYLVWECICNGFAELTYFADREFYQDWWNSTLWDEFARKWNKPVHEWLFRHVYLETFTHMGFSRNLATIVTFLFSSLLHEMVLTVVFRTFAPWLILLQMGQLPMIWVGRRIKKTRFGNVFFWWGILTGIPLLFVLYCREALKASGVPTS